MLYGLDTETHQLNATAAGFICASICTEKMKCHTFWNRKELHTWLTDLAQKLHLSGKTATFYAHNMNYDFYASIFDTTDGSYSIISHKPFMADLLVGGKPALHFYCTTSFYPMTLKNAAAIVGEIKLNMPHCLTTDTTIDKDAVQTYCQQDARIALKLIIHLRQKLKKLNINV